MGLEGKTNQLHIRLPGRAAFRALLCAFAATLAVGQSSLAADAVPSTPLTAIPARNWAAECAANEILVIQHPDSYLRYRLHESDEKGDRVLDHIETPEGSVARLIQKDGKPLTPEQDAAEKDRLNALLNSPDSFARHIHRQEENKKIGVKLIRLLPDAMLWTYAPGQPQLPNHSAADAPLVVLDFKPNPGWSAPDMESQPLTGVEGRAWIDPQTKRLIHLDGDVFQAVNIGWGMVAHIYPGGSVTLQQTNAGGQRWVVEHVVEQMTVRALMVKNVRQKLIFDTTDFQPVPAMKYQQAIRMLLDTSAPSH